MKILNLTQHISTTEQKLDGVVDLPKEVIETLKNLLTFNEIPSYSEMNLRALEISKLYLTERKRIFNETQEICKYALIGGAPFFMSALERSLYEHGITPLYSFSKRVSTEETLEDGTVKKLNIFLHTGFVPVSKN
jgi:hypothetical protein